MSNTDVKLCQCGQPSLRPAKSALCRACWQAYHQKWRSLKMLADPAFKAKMRAAVQRATRRRDEEQRAAAKNGHQPWRPEEHAVLLRDDLTNRAAAAMLGRSRPAVAHERRRLGERMGLLKPIRSHAAWARKYFPDQPVAGQEGSK